MLDKKLMRSIRIYKQKTSMSDKLVPDEIVYELAYWTARLMIGNIKGLENIVWQIGEANIDKGYSKFACKCCQIVWKKIQTDHPEYAGIKIKCSTSDINILFTCKKNGIKKKQKSKIELKSAKARKIKGGALPSLEANQPIIYCLRNDKNKIYKIKYSLYYKAMRKSGTDRILERSSRPPVYFDSLYDPSDNIYKYEAGEINQEEQKNHLAKNAVMQAKVKENSANPPFQDDMINRVHDNYLLLTSSHDVLERQEKVLKQANPDYMGSPKQEINDEYVRKTSLEEFMARKKYLEEKDKEQEKSETVKKRIKIRTKVRRPPITLKGEKESKEKLNLNLTPKNG